MKIQFFRTASSLQMHYRHFLTKGVRGKVPHYFSFGGRGKEGLPILLMVGPSGVKIRSDGKVRFRFAGGKTESILLPPSLSPALSRILITCFPGARFVLTVPCTSASHLMRETRLSSAFARGGS